MRKKPVTPRIPAQRKKGKMLNFRVTTAQYTVITDAATAAQVSVSDWLRHRVVGA